ncbi:MAG: hypothetical protein KKC46_18735 [Proteobacteria bacterium]|nr:hypothetical protein [Pseudomonadota bacterium]
MKKYILLPFILLFFTTSVFAANLITSNVYLLNVKWDPTYFAYEGSQIIADVYADTGGLNDISVIGPNGTRNMAYLDWSYAQTGKHIYQAVLAVNPTDINDWEAEYTFQLGSTPYSYNIPNGALTGLDLPATSWNAATKVLSWAPVKGADTYLIFLWDNIGGVLTPTDIIPYINPYTTSYNMTGLYEPWQTVSVMAQDTAFGLSWNPGFYSVVNESAYFTILNPVPIPSAILFLGSGFLGFLGISRKYRKS